MPAAIAVLERSFGESGDGDGQLRLPRHLCSTSDGNIVISDTGNQRLCIFTPDLRRSSGPAWESHFTYTTAPVSQLLMAASMTSCACSASAPLPSTLSGLTFLRRSSTHLLMRLIK